MVNKNVMVETNKIVRHLRRYTWRNILFEVCAMFLLGLTMVTAFLTVIEPRLFAVSLFLSLASFAMLLKIIIRVEIGYLLSNRNVLEAVKTGDTFESYLQRVEKK